MGLFVRKLVFALTAAAIVISPSAALALTYSGSLSSVGVSPGILGSGVWVNPGVTTLDWLVEDMDSGLWHYAYTLTVPRGGISHFIVEVSPSFTLNDIVASNWNPGDLSVADWGSKTGNPGLPEPFHGLKFDESSGLSTTFELYTYRAPVWGDFYAKDGTAGNPSDVFNVAYNAGFDSAPPSIPAGEGPIANKILVPDTNVPGNLIPEANTLALAGMGLASLLGFRARFVRRK